ncbi:MAG TPA: hypothetical protein VLX58_04205 [Bryobacteraceae bacterium]|nr:hypothetical protein [Bryobacteraceae bacterium]
MNTIQQAGSRFLRGPGASRFLRSLGIDPRRYWLLMDLFGQLSERREMLSQLGRQDVTLKTAAWWYFVLSGICTVLYLAVGSTLATYFWTFLGITAFLLLSVLLSETSSSLVNPVEGLVLSHQPINGATYTAAKLTHLLRILFYLVPGLNAVPAVGGLLLKESPWFYPLVHMLAAFGVGVLAALFCCAIFGWLIRFVPAPRLKAAGQTAEMLPWIAFMLLQTVRDALGRVHIPNWLPSEAAPRRYLALTSAVIAAGILVLGIRSLSGDYLIRVSSIMHGRSAARPKARRSRLGSAVARVFGGPASRAGFEYVSRMMLRDWQFRRQLIPLLIALVAPALLLAPAFRTSPFSGRFTPMHVLPHAFGIVLFLICMLLAYGSDYKGTWIFLLSPAGAFSRFVRGVYAALWLRIIVIPHLILLACLGWFWGMRSAGLFIAYSAAAASAYLGLELRLIDGVPFGKQADAARGSIVMMPLLMAGGLAMAIAVAVQYFLLFHSHAIVAMATLAVSLGAYFATRSSLQAFEVSIRYNLGLLSAETQHFYKEIA